MFKELLVKSAIMPCREIEDFIIDSKYSKYTTYNSKPNSNPITLNRFTELLLYIAKLKYPYEPDDEALGKLCKMWLYPYLLWNLP